MRPQLAGLRDERARLVPEGGGQVSQRPAADHLGLSVGAAHERAVPGGAEPRHLALHRAEQELHHPVGERSPHGERLVHPIDRQVRSDALELRDRLADGLELDEANGHERLRIGHRVEPQPVECGRDRVEERRRTLRLAPLDQPGDHEQRPLLGDLHAISAGPEHVEQPRATGVAQVVQVQGQAVRCRSLPQLREQRRLVLLEGPARDEAAGRESAVDHLQGRPRRDVRHGHARADPQRAAGHPGEHAPPLLDAPSGPRAHVRIRVAGAGQKSLLELPQRVARIGGERRPTFRLFLVVAPGHGLGGRIRTCARPVPAGCSPAELLQEERRS